MKKWLYICHPGIIAGFTKQHEIVTGTRFSSWLFAPLFLGLIASCAKIGSPTGGPKDEDPPRVVSSKPANYSTRFNEKRFEVTFDEFIQLKDVSTQLIVSPPLAKRPDTRLRGKGFVVEFQDTLRENITYTFNFGNAVTDNNEGNALPGFSYVFSTGDYLDSLVVQGRVINAFNLQPDKDGVFVVLHDHLNDSAPLTKIPMYVGKTDKDGFFRIENIRPGTYLPFALKDANSNFRFDVPSEMIAFSDSLLTLDSRWYQAPLDPWELDSLQKDSLKPEVQLPSNALHFRLFQEDKGRQYLTSRTRADRRKITLTTSRPLVENPPLAPVNFEAEGHWYLLESSVNKDTLNYWILDSAIYAIDTLTVAVAYPVPDSLGNPMLFNDTVNARFTPPVTRQARGRGADASAAAKGESLVLASPFKSGIIDLGQDWFVEVDQPILDFDPSRFSISKMQDTLEIPVTFALQRDPDRPRRLLLDWKPEENTPYKAHYLPGFVNSVYQITNDTIQISFKTQKLDFYGTLLLNLSGVKGQVIVQVVDEKERVVQEKIATADGQLRFPFLKATKYRFKLVHDTNQNGKWDTGDYLTRVQPERVVYFKDEINMRSNWDLEVNWVLD